MIPNSYFFIPDYQMVAGPLTEFDPAAILAEVNDDLNRLINRAFEFVLTNRLSDDLGYSMQGTFNYVSKELSIRGITLDSDSVVTYAGAIQNIGKEFMRATSTSPYWFSRYGKWVGARYSANSPGSVEFYLNYSECKFPEYEGQVQHQEITPKLLTVVDMLLGNLGGRL